MFLPRMTTRRWMIAVAAVALLLWATTLISRVVVFRHRSDWHAQQERYDLETAALTENPTSPGAQMYCKLFTRDQLARMASDLRRQAADHARLRLKYVRTARRPWLAAPPGP
jgi:hypothetical protein